ncbi:sorbin and SH3 domain-containing protein 1 isoform X30 [Drosophila eugracilis]|uniref:sorbin and SH3 domain-containing protein 1 isoform X30 n=1 Tax=Drosophila eugracilis TaxID=29029 RepID=UPI0007E638B4|nr:sorbin and SH3 domain-containing protein 1 isoform X30 [Drosophila eugracilis]
MIHQTLAPHRSQSSSYSKSKAVHWRQKLHRSCNDLELEDERFPQSQSLWRSPEINENPWQRPQSSGADSNIRNSSNVTVSGSSNNNGCDIPNCGKILWIHRRGYDYERSAPLRPPSPSNYQGVPGAAGYHVVGLPHTPQPSQRQAYLANQRAIGASMPLILWQQQQQLQQQQQRHQQLLQQQQQQKYLRLQHQLPSKSPNRYYATDVNIHFKTPIRHEQRQNVPEEELAIRQAEHMQKLYHEERRRKYLQELQDMNSRRHTDNFTPSQKSPIALNRYDDFPTDVTLKSLVGPKTVARALFNFQGQSSKELSFRKGDTIYIRRQIDANWYEGEHNAMIGLLPASYVEIVSRDGARTPSKRPSEGQARAKYNFQAQSGIELSLNKGELVTLTRRVDGNWFEGKIANRKGIFPCSYVEVLTDIGAEDIAARTTTVITTQSTTNLRPNLDVLRTNINNEFNTLTQNGAQPPNGILKETRTLHKTDALHVDTSSEPLAYRALYKYRPQNSDELELLEGDVVHVLEKCDDGWFVGTSQRTGCFGTFPGNYVERA